MKPGAVLLTDLGRGGAAIVGRVVPDDAALRPDWGNAYVHLITHAGGSQRWLPGEVEADGSFVVPNVPPGDHELMAVLESAAVIRQNQFPVELGATPRVPVSVPDETVASPHAISVGTVTLRMRPPRETAQPSREAAESSMTEGRVVITVEAQPPHFYLRNHPVTLEQLQAELGAQAAINRDLSVAVRVQTNSPIGILLKAMDAVKAAGFSRPATGFSIRPGETGAPKRDSSGPGAAADSPVGE